MPLYEYECNQCNKIFSLVRNLNEYKEKGKCPNCGLMSERIMSVPNVVTDTNFGYTGKVDKRLGRRPIAGRKDFRQRVRKKGYIEIDKTELSDFTDDKKVKLPHALPDKI